MSKSVALLLVLFLLTALLLTATNQYCNAQYSGIVTIKADGTVDPADAPIQRVGNTYTLTGGVAGISVYRSNIILGGNGYTLPGTVSWVDSLGNNVSAKHANGPYLSNVENVIVKNWTIRDCLIGIFLECCLNVTVAGNTITETHAPLPGLQPTGGIYVWGGGSHVISGNHIANNTVGIYLGDGTEHNIIVDNNITYNTRGIQTWAASSSNNTVYHNSFVNNTVQVYNIALVNTWDDGARGNYWSDYNGTDADGDGIGDTPYVIDGNNQDNYPLIAPYKEPKLEESQPDPFPTTLVIASIASVAVIGVGLLVYFKKRKH